MSKNRVVMPQKRASRTPFTRGNKGEGRKSSGGAYSNGTGGHTAAGAVMGPMVAGAAPVVPPAPMP